MLEKREQKNIDLLLFSLTKTKTKTKQKLLVKTCVFIERCTFNYKE